MARLKLWVSVRAQAEEMGAMFGEPSSFKVEINVQESPNFAWFRTRGARPELLEGLRSFPVGSDIIFYLPRSRGIDVIRVLHGARDLKPFFLQEPE